MYVGDAHIPVIRWLDLRISHFDEDEVSEPLQLIAVVYAVFSQGM